MYGLYIHIPFCIKKCKYCDFVSYTDCNRLFDSYIDCVLTEARAYSQLSFDTVFIGGGTPTILSADQLSRLLCGLKNTLHIKKDAEFSIEANPKTLTHEKLSVLSENGINRLSIGVQSFSDTELSFLGRIHSASDAKATIDLAKSFFDNINIDLMLNLPYQSAANALTTLKEAVLLEPSHISCYSLIIEENTELFSEYQKGSFLLPDEDTDRRTFEAVCRYLAANGYARYEISNFSKPGFECRHNLKYWNCNEYIGLGAAAHSYLNDCRFYNTPDIYSYLSGNTIEEKIDLSASDKMSEFMIMGLRKTAGIDIYDFSARFNKNIFEVFNLDKFLNCGLLLSENGRLYLSEHGLDVSNSILCEFV